LDVAGKMEKMRKTPNAPAGHFKNLIPETFRTFVRRFLSDL